MVSNDFKYNDFSGHYGSSEGKRHNSHHGCHEISLLVMMFKQICQFYSCCFLYCKIIGKCNFGPVHIVKFTSKPSVSHGSLSLPPWWFRKCRRGLHMTTTGHWCLDSVTDWPTLSVAGIERWYLEATSHDQELQSPMSMWWFGGLITLGK